MSLNDVLLNPNALVETPRQAIRAIIAAEAAREGLGIADILGKRRLREIVRARHAAMRAVRARYPNKTYPEIARVFRCNHSSVMYALGALKKTRRP